MDVSLKYAEGPFGRWTSVIASGKASRHQSLGSVRTRKRGALGFFLSSFTTQRCLYPRPAAHPAILPSSNPLPFFLRMNSAPGNTPTSSSQKSYVIFVALGEVVIKILGGMLGSSVDVKYEAKGSDAISTADSSGSSGDEEGPGSLGSAVKIDGSNSLVLSRVLGIFSARRFYTSADKSVHIPRARWV